MEKLSSSHSKTASLSLKNYRSKLHNRKISMKRALVEYPFAIMKRVFHFSHTLVTFSRRVRVKFMFSCFAYNLFALNILNG